MRPKRPAARVEKSTVLSMSTTSQYTCELQPLLPEIIAHQGQGQLPISETRYVCSSEVYRRSLVQGKLARESAWVVPGFRERYFIAI